MITACNTVIYKAQGIEGDAKLINRYVANVRFLRAWGYFNLVQTFGAVPLMTDHVTELTYDMGRTPVAEVYQLIEDDLLFCLGEDVLPKEIDGGWANYWAAKTLLAKVYITMASARAADRVAGYEQIEQTDEKLYGDALALLQDVITNSGRDLESVYGDVFKIENKNINGRKNMVPVQSIPTDRNFTAAGVQMPLPDNATLNMFPHSGTIMMPMVTTSVGSGIWPIM